MKRIHILVIFIVLTMFTFISSGQVNLGLKAGLGSATTSIKGNSIEELKSNFTGFHAGPIIDFGLPFTNIGFDVAVLYSQTGFKIKNTEAKEATLDFPINMKLKVPISQQLKLFATAGPYLSFKLTGDNFDFNEEDLEDEYMALKGQWESKSFAVGTNFGAGCIINQFQLGITYKVCFSDQYSSLDFDNLSAKSKTWFFELAYFF